MIETIVLSGLSIAGFATLYGALSKLKQKTESLYQQRLDFHSLLTQQQSQQQEAQTRFQQFQIDSLQLIQDGLRNALSETRTQVNDTLKMHTQVISQHIQQLTQETRNRLQEIGGVVDKQLASGFEKTTATFCDVLKRLTIIDEAQKRMTDLSSNVISLQEILTDKRSRGAFGEVQLQLLIQNMLPENHFAFQHTLSNGKRADCILFLPPPSGWIAIDAKFPLENYRLLHQESLSASEKNRMEQQFRLDIRKHIQDIAEKYIIPGETADGAVMFIPAEAIFADIHSHFSELIDYAHRHRVWLVSPTTLMAVLTTARAVIKDAATQKQVHIIQEHLIALSKDFERFQKRMDNLSKHIQLAHQDAEEVHKSSQKITSRFNKIEKVEMEGIAAADTQDIVGNMG